MSEPLAAFRERAEELTRLPAFELIEQRGRARRRRRYAVAGVMAAGTLALAGFLALDNGRSDQPLPAEDPEPSSLVTPYPGNTMTTLERGTYELAPSSSPSRPLVRFTLPPGWNAWVGPNRFEGMGPQVTDNGALLDQGIDWYLGLLVLEVDKVAGRDCLSIDVSDRSTAAFARELARMPGLDVTTGPESTVRFDRPAVHLRLQRNTEQPCPWFFNTPLGYTGGSDDGSTYDAWAIDVDGRPLLVWAEWTRLAPRADVDALLGVVDSIELDDPE